MLRQIVQPLVRGARNGTRSYHAPADYKHPHMDDLPLPSGSWKENYEKLQRKYNIQLIGGTAFLIGTIIFGKVSGLFYLNWAPPTPKN